MTVTGRLELVALDATDIAGLASFYAQLTGWQTVRNVDGWITLRAGDGQEVAFQQVAEHIPPQWPDRKWRARRQTHQAGNRRHVDSTDSHSACSSIPPLSGTLGAADIVDRIITIDRPVGQ